MSAVTNTWPNLRTWALHGEIKLSTPATQEKTTADTEVTEKDRSERYLATLSAQTAIASPDKHRFAKRPRPRGQRVCMGHRSDCRVQPEVEKHGL